MGPEKTAFAGSIFRDQTTTEEILGELFLPGDPRKGKIMKKLVVCTLCLGLLSTPAIAGEITGNGKELDVNGRSSCAYSGLNDTPFGDVETSDPGGRVQSYGYFFAHTWLHDYLDPAVNDPREPSLSPGWSCNPQRGGAFEPGG